MDWSLTRRSLLSLAALLGSGLKLSFAGGERTPKSPAPNLGVITDELSEDFDKALEFISEHSLGYCEVRELWNKNVTRLSQEELEHAKQLIEEHQLKVSEIASPLFKYHLPGMPSPRPNWGDTFKAADLTDKDTENLLERVFRLAPFFGTSKVRVFSYWRVEDPEKAYPLVRDRLAKAAARAAENNITLLLENETDCNVGTEKSWDGCPGDQFTQPACYVGSLQCAGAGSSLPRRVSRSPRTLPPYARQGHAKDPATGKFRYVPVGKGEIDYRGQFKALRDDGYKGTMPIETSYVRPDKDKLEATRECLEGLLSVWK